MLIIMQVETVNFIDMRMAQFKIFYSRFVIFLVFFLFKISRFLYMSRIVEKLFLNV